MKCRKCNCSYFIQLPASKLDDETYRSISTPIPVIGETFLITTCAACGLSAPIKVFSGAHTPYMTEYTEFVKEIKECQEKK